MLEEVKEIVNMINSLPHLALWVLAGFWAYKVIIIGSWYALVRFAIEAGLRWHKTQGENKKEQLEMIARKELELMRAQKEPARPMTEAELERFIQGIVITHDGTHLKLREQLQRVVGRRVSIATNYIHTQSVEWLAEAITEKDAREKAVDVAETKA